MTSPIADPSAPHGGNAVEVPDVAQLLDAWDDDDIDQQLRLLDTVYQRLQNALDATRG